MHYDAHCIIVHCSWCIKCIIIYIYISLFSFNKKTGLIIIINVWFCFFYRWSKIAKHLPGRTDNEIKNYWRTRIQKHIKQVDNFTNLPLNLDNNINMDQPTVTDQQVVSSCVPAVHAVSQSYDPPNSSFQENMSNFQYPNFPTQSIDHNIWSTDEFWPMLLLNQTN